MVANRSYETAGIDDPAVEWMKRSVRVKAHPEWGQARVIRWFPADGDQPERLRIMTRALLAPQIVAVADVEITVR